MMTFDEYKNQIIKSLKDDYNIEDSYINKLDEDIKKSYDDGIVASELLGSNQISPSGYCYGISMMYPDLP